MLKSTLPINKTAGVYISLRGLTMTTTHLILSVIAAVLVFALLYFIIKELIKVVAVFTVLMVIYVGYLTYTGQRIPSSRDELVQQGVSAVQTIKEGGGKLFDSVAKDAKAAGKKENP